MRFRVSVDPEKCVACGDCVRACAYGVLEIIDNVAYPTEPKECKGCKDCSEECEARAISVTHI